MAAKSFYKCPYCAAKRSGARPIFDHIFEAHPDSEHSRVWRVLINVCQSEAMRVATEGIVKSIMTTWKKEVIKK